MGSTRKGMLNVLIAAVLWEVQGLRAIHHGAKARCRRSFDYDAFDIRRFDSADAIICSW